MDNQRGKLKDTKLGAWFRDKAPDVLASVGDVVPGGQVLKAVGALIDATTTSEQEKEEARMLLLELQAEDRANARDREVRQPLFPHADILIWGTQEARVQGADLLICAGLNDGIWPPAPKADPWLNRALRA